MIKISDNSRISAPDVWSLYMGIQLHFKPGSYDAFKFNFKGPRLKIGSPTEARNKWTLDKLSKKYTKNDLILYFLANTISGNSWIGGMSDEVYQEWVAKIQRMDYTFKSEMSNMLSECEKFNLSFDETILPKDRSNFPLIYTLHQRNKLSLESLVILNNLISFTKDVINNFKDPLDIISDINHRILKYSKFLNSEMNLDKHRDIIINLFTNVKK